MTYLLTQRDGISQEYDLLDECIAAAYAANQLGNDRHIKKITRASSQWKKASQRYYWELVE